MQVWHFLTRLELTRGLSVLGLSDPRTKTPRKATGAHTEDESQNVCCCGSPATFLEVRRLCAPHLAAGLPLSQHLHTPVPL